VNLGLGRSRREVHAAQQVPVAQVRTLVSPGRGDLNKHHATGTLLLTLFHVLKSRICSQGATDYLYHPIAYVGLRSKLLEIQDLCANLCACV